MCICLGVCGVSRVLVCRYVCVVEVVRVYVKVCVSWRGDWYVHNLVLLIVVHELEFNNIYLLV